MAPSAYTFTLSLASGSCGGPTLGGYCCPGSIINPSGDLFNNNDNSVDGVICCVGDPSGSINNGPSFSTCTAGTATALSEAPTSTTLSPFTGSLSLSSLSIPAVTLTGTTNSHITIDGTTVGGGTNPTSTTASSQSDSSNGAANALRTAAPAIGGAVVAALGLF